MSTVLDMIDVEKLEGDEVFYVIKDGKDYKATFDQVKEAILKESQPNPIQLGEFKW